MGNSTQKFMGRGQLVDRLAAQVGGRDLAVKLLRERGMMEKNSEKLTAKGEARNNMTAEERAVDRAAKASKTKQSKSAFAYNPKTNRATLKK